MVQEYSTKIDKKIIGAMVKFVSGNNVSLAWLEATALSAASAACCSLSPPMLLLIDHPLLLLLLSVLKRSIQNVVACCCWSGCRSGWTAPVCCCYFVVAAVCCRSFRLLLFAVCCYPTIAAEIKLLSSIAVDEPTTVVTDAVDPELWQIDRRCWSLLLSSLLSVPVKRKEFRPS